MLDSRSGAQKDDAENCESEVQPSCHSAVGLVLPIEGMQLCPRFLPSIMIGTGSAGLFVLKRVHWVLDFYSDFGKGGVWSVRTKPSIPITPKRLHFLYSMSFNCNFLFRRHFPFLLVLNVNVVSAFTTVQAMTYLRCEAIIVLDVKRTEKLYY